MLYSPEAHEPLESRPWDPDAALTAIREIAADCEASLQSPYWPVHPRDAEDDGPFTTIYMGSAGVIYALDVLAFLKLHRRTGDELWLDRARAFAMHAAAQVERERRAVGHGRFALWTGDLGTALYLALCVAGDTSVPGFDDI